MNKRCSFLFHPSTKNYKFQQDSFFRDIFKFSTFQQPLSTSEAVYAWYSILIILNVCKHELGIYF